METTEAERELAGVLAGIWGEVLGIDGVDRDRHILDLGGTSISSVLISTRARELGLPLTPRLVFTHPTVHELSAALAAAGHEVPAGTGDRVAATIPLAPAQRALLAVAPSRRPGRCTVLLRTDRPLDPAAVRTALTALSDHHDALRLRLTDGAAGWSQHVAEPGTPVPLALTDDAGTRAEAETDASLDTPLFTATLVGGTALVLAVHPLVADRRSMRQLVDEFALAYEQLSHGGPVHLPRATSFGRWSRTVSTWVGSAAAEDELPHWLALAGRDPAPHPPNSPEWTVTAELAEERTAALLEAFPGGHRPGPDDALLAALAAALPAGGAELVAAVDCDGRAADADQDFSRTVGPCTTPAPVRLSGNEPAAMPRGELGFASLRWLSLNEDTRAALAATPFDVGVRYLAGARAAGPFQVEAERPEPRRHPVEVTASVHNGRLRVAVTCAAGTFDGLADAVAARLGEAGGDRAFPLSGLGSGQLGALLAGIAEEEMRS